jgi:cyanophycinase-like exopeptidase
VARRLVLMGSGETTPTMVETHKRVLSEVGPNPRAILLDTPYGFQENADEITARTVDYFAQSTSTRVTPVSLRVADALSASALGDVAARVEEADWVFAGPGSPTYLRRQWEGTAVPDAVRRRLDQPGATVFASAAACSVGLHTVPVYEIYKVGQAPHWQEGFDLTGHIGLRCVVIPHFDNAEGGTHDTRYCYLGERRLAAMEQELPDDVWVLGVDEHTALVVDLDDRTTRIEGRGVVTVRRRGRHVTFGPGDTPTLEDLVATATEGVATAAAPAPTPAPADTVDTGTGGSALLDEVDGHVAAFDAAMASDDALGAAEAVVALEETIHAWAADVTQSDEMDRARRTLHRLVLRLARTTQAGLHDHRELVAPLVEELLDLREGARADRDFDVGDRIRDRLQEAGVEVRDTSDGADWAYADPLDAD